MSSLYQRFAGKIDTSESFPNPPEANHLLGKSDDGERGTERQRPRLQPRYHRGHCEDEDVRTPYPTPFLIYLFNILFNFCLPAARCVLMKVAELIKVNLIYFKGKVVKQLLNDASSPQLAGLCVNK